MVKKFLHLAILCTGTDIANAQSTTTFVYTRTATFSVSVPLNGSKSGPVTTWTIPKVDPLAWQVTQLVFSVDHDTSLSGTILNNRSVATSTFLTAAHTYTLTSPTGLTSAATTLGFFGSYTVPANFGSSSVSFPVRTATGQSISTTLPSELASVTGTGDATFSLSYSWTGNLSAYPAVGGFGTVNSPSIRGSWIITARPVPEPSAGLGLLAGAVALLRRKR